MFYRGLRGPSARLLGALPIRVGLRGISSDAGIEDLKKHIKFLTSELATHKQLVSDLVKLVDKVKHAEELRKMNLNIDGGGGFFVPHDSNELMRALQTPGARVTLEKDRVYFLSTPIVIKQTNISINGNGASIIGRFIVQDKSTFSASDTSFYHAGGHAFTRQSSAGRTLVDKTSQPLFDVTRNSEIYLRHCHLSSARDGVYLGLKSTANIRFSSISNCVRGIYEGVGCSARVENTKFSGNIFHGVFLGVGKEKRYEFLTSNGSTFERTASEELIYPKGYQCEPPLPLRESRADIALEHDPISDSYDCFFKDGQPITLAESERNTGLTDPVY